MFLVAGLGNPGLEYAKTPHNVGFMVVDLLAERHAIRVTRPESRALVGRGEIEGKPVMLAKPLTFMNLSGSSIAPLMSKHAIQPAELILVYDDLDLPWPSLRVKPRGSAGSHNGVKSVVASLGTKDFPRVRIGIETGRAERRDGVSFVLGPFKRSQEKELKELIGHAADAVTSIIAEGVEKAMTTFNRRAGG